MEQSIRWDRINRVPVWQHAWHDKDPFPLKSHIAPSNFFEWSVKQYTTKQYTTIDWLIYWIVFYGVLAKFHPEPTNQPTNYIFKTRDLLLRTCVWRLRCWHCLLTDFEGKGIHSMKRNRSGNSCIHRNITLRWVVKKFKLINRLIDCFLYWSALAKSQQWTFWIHKLFKNADALSLDERLDINC